jgi:dUTPase.
VKRPEGETVKFDKWLAEQRKYQAQTFNVDYMLMDVDVDELTKYVTMNLNAAFLELAETQQEVPWKPWAKTEDRAKVWSTGRDKVVGEIVDVLMFVGNVLTAVNCTDSELAQRYEAKMEVNRQRQAAGYDNANKCDGCGRAFDDHGVKLAGVMNAKPHCEKCWEAFA